MAAYFTVFAIVTILGAFADFSYKRSKKMSVFFVILSILTLSIFAGIRAFNVGTDINVYGLRRFSREIGNSSFIGGLSSYNDIEYGYSLLNHLIAKLTHDYHWFLFVHQLIISTIVYIIAFKEKSQRGTKISLTALSYVFLYFNTSLNILRQSIAIFIQLYAYRFLEEGKPKKYLIASVIAILFHTSSMIFLIMPILYKFYSRKNSTLRIALVSVMLMGSFFILSALLNYISTFLPIIEKYALYTERGQAVINIRYLAFKILMFVAILVFMNIASHNKKFKKGMMPLLALSAFDVVFYALSGFIMYGYRLSYFFLVHYIYFLPRIETGLKKNNSLIYKIILIALLVGYWINRFILSNYDGTLPYVIGI